MNILKALLLTALLLGIETLMSIGIYEYIEPKIADKLNSDYLIHFYGLTNRIPTILSYLLVFFIFHRAIFNWKKGLEKAKTIDTKIISTLIIIAVGLELFDRPFFDFSKIFDYFSGAELEPFKFSESSSLSILYRGISVLLIAPIFEELFFRKFLFGELLKKYSLPVSIIVSSVCFALIHLPSYKNLFPTFIFGIITCLIYYKTNNIFYTIILHFLTNLSWLLLASFGKSYYEWIYGLHYDLIYWSLFIFGTGLLYAGIKKITAANTGYNSAWRQCKNRK